MARRYTLLRPPIYKTLGDIDDLLLLSDLSSLEAKLQPVYYIIIDERSIFGLRTFSRVHDRPRQAFPESQD
jgi:hypothetical protein